MTERIDCPNPACVLFAGHRLNCPMMSNTERQEQFDRHIKHSKRRIEILESALKGQQQLATFWQGKHALVKHENNTLRRKLYCQTRPLMTSNLKRWLMSLVTLLSVVGCLWYSLQALNGFILDLNAQKQNCDLVRGAGCGALFLLSLAYKIKEDTETFQGRAKEQEQRSKSKGTTCPTKKRRSGAKRTGFVT